MEQKVYSICGYIDRERPLVSKTDGGGHWMYGFFLSGASIDKKKMNNPVPCVVYDGDAVQLDNIVANEEGMVCVEGDGIVLDGSYLNENGDRVDTHYFYVRDIQRCYLNVPFGARYFKGAPANV